MTSWNPGETPDPSGQPPQYGQQPPPPPPYGAPAPPPQYGQQPPYGAQPPQYQSYPGGANPYGSGAPNIGQPAEVVKRLLAALLDLLIIGVPLVILYVIFVAVWVSKNCVRVGNDLACNNSTSGGATAIIWLLVILTGFLYPMYFIGMRSGSTIGMSIIGTKVIDAQTGQLIGFGRAFLRQLLYGICIIVAFSSFFDSSPLHQGWHDKVANSIVIRTK